MITAIMIAQKFNHDESYSNAEIVKLLEPEYTIKQLNKMEATFLDDGQVILLNPPSCSGTQQRIWKKTD